MLKGLSATMKNYNLTESHKILKELFEKGKLNTNELAKSFNKKDNTVRIIMSRLKSRSLIEIEKIPGRRINYYFIPEKSMERARIIINQLWGDKDVSDG